MVSVLVLSNIALAQRAPVEVRRLSVTEARESVQKLNIYKEIEKARTQGRDILTDAALKPKLNKVVEITLKNITSVSAVESNNLIRLLSLSPLDVMSEVARLSSVSKDRTSTAAEKSVAVKNLELIIKASNTVDGLVLNEVDAAKQQAKVKEIIKISEKISNLGLGEKSEQFTKKYERALIEGKSISEAVKIASEGKFTEKELRDCI